METAIAVCISGLGSVFAVLLILQIGIQITGSVIDSMAKKQTQQQNG